MSEKNCRHEDKDHGRRERQYRQQRQQEYVRSYTDAGGIVRPDLLRGGIEDFRRMKVVVARPRRIAKHPRPRPGGAPGGGGAPGAVGLVGSQWVPIGPAPLRIDAEQIYQGAGPVSGRVDDIAIDPTGATDQILYIAAIGGGIWKSTDGGTTWAPKMNSVASQSTFSVALDPSNPSTVWAGTGGLGSLGLFKSIDAGETWSLVGSGVLSGRSIKRIVLPTSNVLLVATNFGLYRSVDGGVHFGSNAPTFDNNAPVLGGSITELRLDTSSPTTTVLAAVSGVGLFRSTDAGATFPENLFANPGAPTGTYSYVAFAQSTQPNNHTLYAYVAASPYRGLFKSTNSGSNWNELPDAAARAAENGGAQLGYDQTLGVDPQDRDRVYLGFQEFYVSTDGGNSFATPAISRFKIHWDHHALVFSPASHWGAAPTRFYVCTDGGLSASSNGGTTFANLNEGIGTNLFYGIDIGRGGSDHNGYSYGGCQDTGTVERRPGFAANDWHLGVDGDGGPVAVDPRDPLRCYGSDDYGYIRTANGGTDWNFIGGGSGLPFVRVLAVDPNASNIVYGLAGSTLYQSNNGGDTYTAMHTFASPLQSISIAELDSSTVWVGLGNGTVARTHDALLGVGATWATFSVGLPVGRAATSIAVDPANEQRVVVGYGGVSGIAPTSRTQHVYMTTNDGGLWSDISGTDGAGPLQNLPDLPVSAVAVDADPLVGLFGVGASSGLTVAVGLFGNVVTAPDGMTWTAHVSGTSRTLAAVTWGGDKFVAVGLGGVILTSPDGANWTERKSGPSWEALQGVAHSGTCFVVTSASTAQVYVSADGLTWTPHAVPGGHALLDVTWTGSQFVAVGYSGTILTSPDGLAWTACTSGTTEHLVSVVASGSRIVAGGQNGALTSSPTGATWTVRASGTTAEINGVARSGSAFVAVLNSGGVLTSPDGDTWTAHPGPTGHRLNDVTWNGSRFVAIGDFGSIFTSTDGATWADHSYGSVLHSILALSDAGVAQTTDLGATWHVLGVGLPQARCTSLALDPFANPSLLRVGTYGRSAWDLVTVPGPRLAIAANLAFGRVVVGSPSTINARLFNVGANPLILLSITRTAGSADFTFSGLALPATLAPGAEADLVVQLQPSAVGDRTAAFTITSDDFVAPSQVLPASGTGI